MSSRVAVAVGRCRLPVVASDHPFHDLCCVAQSPSVIQALVPSALLIPLVLAAGETLLVVQHVYQQPMNAAELPLSC
jgi:hypothetical protein